jgi:hypothetical protein
VIQYFAVSSIGLLQLEHNFIGFSKISVGVSVSVLITSPSLPDEICAICCGAFPTLVITFTLSPFCVTQSP